MGIYEVILVVSVLLILSVARLMSGREAAAPEERPPARGVNGVLLVVLAFVVFALVYAVLHAH